MSCNKTMLPFAAGLTVGIASAIAIMGVLHPRRKAQKRLAKGNTIFLLCDIQEKFVPVIDKMSQVIASAKGLLATADAMNIPVIATEQYPKALGHTVKDLDVTKAQVFAKTLFSMCTPEVLEAILATKRKSAVIFGVEAHVCVQQTTMDLLERGFEVHIAADAVSSQRPDEASFALARLEAAGAVITTSESVMFELMRDKDTPEFKAVSAAVKDLANTKKTLAA